jgi:hypothetical protein
VTSAKTCVRVSHKIVKRPDSGLSVIPDPDRGRNDKKWGFLAFYEAVKDQSMTTGTFVSYGLCLEQHRGLSYKGKGGGQGRV